MVNETVAVIGAGTMGNGIAEVFAVAGYAVRLHRLDPEPVRGGTRTAFYEALLEVERR